MLTEQSDILFYGYVSLRNRRELTPLVGLFTNLLSFRSDLTGDPTFAALVRSTHGTISKGLQHQELGLAEQCEILPVAPADVSLNAFQICFVFVHDAPAMLEMQGLDVVELPMGRDAYFDLTIHCNQLGEELDVIFEYRTDLYTPAVISTMVSRYMTLLERVAFNPAARLSALTRSISGP
jgi:non-ribosomal peptide synthetase component F